MRYLVVPIATLVSCLTLAACGGGGSGSTSPPPTQTTNSTPTISASPSGVTTNAMVTDAAPSANVNLTFANAPSTVFLSVDDTTTNGISSVGTPSYDSTKGSFTINFKSPANLKPADYSDTLTVLLCSDAQCKVVLASQPVKVTYTVKAATGSSAPSVTLDSTTQTQSALYYQSVPSPNVNLDPTAFTFTNFQGTPHVQVSAPTTGGIGAPSFEMKDATHGGLVFTFAPPSSVAQNTYTTPVTVNVCIDPNCVNVVQTFTVSVNYIVANKITVAGDSGYTIAAYPVAAQLLAANVNLTSVLALVPPAAAPATLNSIQAIDPATGTATATLALSESPNRALALADDGSYLYVNGPTQVQQVQTATLSAGYTIPAPNGVNTSVVVQPGNPQTIALGYTDMKIFDGTTARTHVYSNPGYVYESLAWTSNPAVVAARQVGNTLELECGFAVNSSGFDISGAPTCISAFANSAVQTFVFSGGFGYGSGGGILSESDWTMVASLPTTAPRTLSDVLPDSQTKRAFAFYSTPDGSSCSLQSFALPANTALANIPLPLGTATCPYNNLVRWGANGLAFTTGTDLVVVTGKFVAP
jgi:hypothetical protein